MGTIPSNSSIGNENKDTEKQHEIISYDLDEGIVTKHKVIETTKKDKQIRHEYLRKINEGLKKENEERFYKTSEPFDLTIGSVSYLDYIDHDYFDESSTKASRERNKFTSVYKKQTRCQSTEQKDYTLSHEVIYVDIETYGKTDRSRKKNLSDINGDRISVTEEVLPKTKIKSTSQSEYEIIFLKSAENLRRAYIAKLIYKNVWTPNKIEKDHNTIIIFDWDDTLLCTSFLTPNGIFNEDIQLNEKDFEKIMKLEQAVMCILTHAIHKGDTYIITNAAPGWVEYSANRFYPSVKKILEKVKIVSARGDFESIYPGDSRMWKIQAFLKMQTQHNTNLVTNIICLGDSFIEMEAGHVLASKYQQAFIKTVKFRESPRPEELHKQLLLVSDQFSSIFSLVKNLTIRVEKKIK
jgi:hypothetical protein